MKRKLMGMAFVLVALFFPRILFAAGSTCNVTLNPTYRAALSASGTGSISVTAATDCAWTSSIDVSWISYAFLSSTNGVGNGAISYTFSANPTANPRMGSVTINGKFFTITQAGLNCSVTLNPASSLVSSASGTGSVSVTASNGCAWTAISNASWIDFAVLSSSSGTGNGTVQYVVSANTSDSTRTGTITISGQTFTITQTGSGATTNNLLTNPGFESGASSWTESSSGGYAITNNDPAWNAHTGGYYAWLGGYNSATDFIQQNVTIPANAQAAFVQFWYQIATSETNAGGALDNLTIDLVSAATGVKLATLKALSNLDASAGWVQSLPFDVSAYKGQTVSLKFTATANASNATDFLIDDVSVLAVTPPVCTLTASPTTISAGGASLLTASCNPAATSYLWVGGSCSSTSPSCSVTPSATTIYTVAGVNVIGSGAIAATTVTFGTGNTGNWTALPGASPSRPSLALNSATGKTQMVVRSATDQLWVGNFTTGGTFEGWNALSGASPSDVAQAWHPGVNKMYMVARAGNDQLYLGTFNSAGSFEGWSALPGASPSPVALAWHPTLNKMYMVARAGNDQLYLGTFNSAGSFEGWSALSGASPSPVALAWHPTLNKMYMVARAGNDQLYLGTFNSAGSFEGWSALSGASPSPVALAWHSTLSKMYMVVRGGDDQLWQGTFGSASGAFEGWSALSGTSPTEPVLAAGQSNLQLVVRSADDQLWSLLTQ